jgi:hypothetical protein
MNSPSSGLYYYAGNRCCALLLGSICCPGFRGVPPLGLGLGLDLGLGLGGPFPLERIRLEASGQQRSNPRSRTTPRYLFRTQYAEGLNRQFLRAQDGHPAPARSSHSPAKQPPWKKCGPSPSQGETSARHSQRHRHVTRGPPPTTPLGGWSPPAPTTAREAKKWPSAAPRCPNQNQKPNQKTTAPKKTPRERRGLSWAAAAPHSAPTAVFRRARCAAWPIVLA